MTDVKNYTQIVCGIYNMTVREINTNFIVEFVLIEDEEIRENYGPFDLKLKDEILCKIKRFIYTNDKLPEVSTIKYFLFNI